MSTTTLKTFVDLERQLRMHDYGGHVLTERFHEQQRMGAGGDMTDEYLAADRYYLS